MSHLCQQLFRSDTTHLFSTEPHPLQQGEHKYKNVPREITETENCMLMQDPISHSKNLIEEIGFQGF